MKIFISWSGNKSHKVALVFREWLPSVIQSIIPYVSSEDIDKGARWSTDIAKELADSSFGILCVTKENLQAPWLSFEAGALSKTMEKSFVIPFLFDIKRSEVNGPILQFQSTIFDKNDIRKLILTINKACTESTIPEKRLDTIFDTWYPTLEQDLNKLKDISDDIDNADSDSLLHNSEILEEILNLSRDNQKLLRNSDNKISEETITELKQKIDSISMRYSDKNIDDKFLGHNPIFIEEFMHELFSGIFQSQKPYGFLIALSMFKDDFPWVYNFGKEMIDILQSNSNTKTKQEAIQTFRRMLEFTCGHPILRNIYGRKKETVMLLREMPYILTKLLNELDIK